MGRIGYELDKFMACRNITKSKLLDAVNSFMRYPSGEGLVTVRSFISPAQYCAAVSFFAFKVEALQSEAATGTCAASILNTSGETAGTTLSSSSTSCNPRTQTYEVVATTINPPNDVRETLAIGVLATAVGCGILALAISDASVSIATMAWQGRRDSGLRLRLSLWLLGTVLSLITYIGGLQAELIPDGLPSSAAARCESDPDSDATTTLISSFAAASSLWSWSAAYYVLSALCSAYGTSIIMGFLKGHIGHHGSGQHSRHQHAKKHRHHAKRGKVGCLRSALRRVIQAKKRYSRATGVKAGKIGPLYMAKVLLFELVETSYQLVSILITLNSQETNIVVTTFFIVGANLIVLPVVVVLALRFWRFEKAVLVKSAVELFFDKTFVIIGIFVRSPTIEALRVKPFYYGPVLLAAVMAILKLRTMRKLIDASIHARVTQKLQRLRDLVKRGTFTQLPAATPTLSQVAQQAAVVVKPKKRRELWEVGRKRLLTIAGLSMTGGLLLITLPASHVTSCTATWTSILGPAALCATPQLFFADSNCGLSRVKALACGTNFSDAVVSGHLPESNQYARLDQLCRIDLAGQKSLLSIPGSWKLLQSLTAVDLSDTLVENIPVEICAARESWVGRSTMMSFSLKCPVCQNSVSS